MCDFAYFGITTEYIIVVCLKMIFFFKIIAQHNFAMRPITAKSYIVEWCIFGRNFLRGILFFCTSYSNRQVKYLSTIHISNI